MRALWRLLWCAPLAAAQRYGGRLPLVPGFHILQQFGRVRADCFYRGFIEVWIVDQRRELFECVRWALDGPTADCLDEFPFLLQERQEIFPVTCFLLLLIGAQAEDDQERLGKVTE